MKFSHLYIVMLLLFVMLPGCKKNDIATTNVPVDSIEATPSKEALNNMELETTDTLTSTTDTDLETTDTETSSTAVTTGTLTQPLDAPPLCIKYGWLPLSKGLVGDMILTSKNEIRLYRPVDPNTSSGINYGATWVELPETDMTSVTLKTRMYRNELIATLPEEVEPPVKVLFGTKRIPEGPEVLEYVLTQIEEKQDANSTRADLRAFSLMEQMKTTMEQLKVSVTEQKWRKIEADVRLLNDQARRYIEFTRSVLDPKQNEAAQLLFRNTQFVLECVKTQTHPDMNALVKKYDEYMTILQSMD